MYRAKQKNDDIISVTATYDTTRAEEQLYKTTIDTMEYTVSGLQAIVFAKLIAGYIESCEEIVQTQSEWLVFEIIND